MKKHGTFNLKDASYIRPAPSIEKCRVMVVDNEQSKCELIKAALKSADIDDVELLHDGENVLDAVYNDAPDLLVLDVNAPGMEVLETLEILRSDFRYNEMPVIVEISNDTKEDVKKLLSIGASNVIRKPFDIDLLISRVRLLLENVMLLRDLRGYQYRLEQELNAAHEMQKELMPRSEFIADVEDRFGFIINAHYQPSMELGGDLWGMQCLDDTRIGFYLVDFSGHGVGASINTFRLHTIMQQFPAPVSPARYLRFLSSQLHDIVQSGQFATMMFAMIDIEKNSLTYSVAGASPPIIYYPKTDQLSVGKGTGLPIGIISDAEYIDVEVPFPEDASLFIYSDAFYETPQIDGDDISLDGVADFIRSTMTRDSGELVLKNILDRFFENRHDFVEDDLTLVLASRLPEDPGKQFR